MNRFEQFTDDELNLLWFDLYTHECIDEDDGVWCDDNARIMCEEIVQEERHRHGAEA